MYNNVRVEKFASLEKLMENNWVITGLNLKEGEDILQLISDEKVLMVYVYKGSIEVSYGDNEGTIDKPEIFTSEVWELSNGDFDNNLGEVIEKVINFC